MDNPYIQALTFFVLPIAALIILLWAFCSSCDSKLWLQKRRFLLFPFLFLISLRGGALAFPDYPEGKTCLSKLEWIIFGSQAALIVTSLILILK